MRSKLGVLDIFPSDSSILWHPLPSTGSLGQGSPASTVLRDAPTPGHPSRRTSFPSLGATAATFQVRSHGCGTRRVPVSLGICWRVPDPLIAGGNDRASQVPGEPPRARATLYDPGGTPNAWPFTTLGVLPSMSITTSAPANGEVSRLNHAAQTLAVYASQRRLPRRHARLASGCWPALPGGIGYPPDSDERFPRITSSLPPFQNFLAQDEGFATHDDVPRLSRYSRVKLRFQSVQLLCPLGDAGEEGVLWLGNTDVRC